MEEALFQVQAHSSDPACEQTNRICYTIELDEKFCDVIVKRYIEQVGSAANVTVVRDGLTYRYDEVAHEDSNR